MASFRSRNVASFGSSNVASFGSSDVANFGSSNVASFGSSNVANFGSSYNLGPYKSSSGKFPTQSTQRPSNFKSFLGRYQWCNVKGH
ncbi:hypothetical protein Lal_00048544, partial [Lupinus albus]